MSGGRTRAGALEEESQTLKIYPFLARASRWSGQLLLRAASASVIRAVSLSAKLNIAYFGKLDIFLALSSSRAAGGPSGIIVRNTSWTRAAW